MGESRRGCDRSGRGRWEGSFHRLAKARDKGIKVVTWDSDAEPDARDFFVNQATPEGIGNALMDNAAKAMGGTGDFAIITASLNATNMNTWVEFIKKRQAEKYPDVHLIDIRPCDDQKDKAFEEANILLNSRKDLKLIMAICSPAVPGAAEAVKQSPRKDVKVMGLGLPNDNKRYIHEGVTDDIVLWNTMDLGYLAVLAAYDLQTGKLKPGDSVDGCEGVLARSRFKEPALFWASHSRLQKTISISLISERYRLFQSVSLLALAARRSSSVRNERVNGDSLSRPRSL